MAQYRKLRGAHVRDEKGNKVTYKKGDIIEATEEELRRVDPNLVTWELVVPVAEDDNLPPSEKDAKVEGGKAEKKVLSRSTKKAEKNIVQLKKVELEGGVFDVVNVVTNKAINDEPVTEEEADRLILDATEPKK